MIRQKQNELVGVNSNEPTVPIDETDEESPLAIEVLGDMPKVIQYGYDSKIQV